MFDKVFLPVAIQEGDTDHSFTFSRTCTLPRTTFRLAVGPLDHFNVTYYVGDAELSAEDFLLGLPVLKHLARDTKDLLEQKRDVLDGYEFSGLINDFVLPKRGKK